MSLGKTIYKSLQASDGGVKLVTLSSIGALAALLVLALGVLPANAGPGDDTTTWEVEPSEVEYGGGAGACAFVGSAAEYELHINNPATNLYSDSNIDVQIDVGPDDEFFDFTIQTEGWAAFDVVVNGGAKNTLFDYDSSLDGIQPADTDLHAPVKGNGSKLYKLSHINICYDLIPEADLSVTKSVDDATPNEGDTIVFSVTATNNSSVGTATGVTITDTLPSQVTAGTLPTACAEAVGVVTCALPSIPFGQSETVDIPVSVNALTEGETFSNIAIVDANEDDPETSNNTSTPVPVTVNSVDLSVTKKADDASPDPEDTVTFEITVENSSESNATATVIEVVDQLPDGMTFVSALPEDTDDGYDATAHSYTWNELNDLLPGGTQTLYITVTIDTDEGGAALTNSVTVSGNETDPDTSENTNNADPPVVVNASLSGRVFVDANASSSFDVGEEPESLIVTVYDTAGEKVAFTTSTPRSTTLPDAPGADDGTYSFALQPGTYTVCLEQRSGHEQTVPDLFPEAPPGTTTDDCSGLGLHEVVGYVVSLTSNTSDLDFGNLPRLACDIEQTTLGTAISGTFKIFTNDNLACGDKGHLLSIVQIETEPGVFVEAVAFLLDGGGEAAARGVITKTESSPAGFVPLTYSPAENGTFVTLPWCKVDDKEGNDGPEFDTDLGNDGPGPIVDQYPDLTGVYDDAPTNSVPSISCKVTQFEDILGNQVTVVFGEFLDPFYR